MSTQPDLTVMVHMLENTHHQTSNEWSTKPRWLAPFKKRNTRLRIDKTPNPPLHHRTKTRIGRIKRYDRHAKIYLWDEANLYQHTDTWIRECCPLCENSQSLLKRFFPESKFKVWNIWVFFCMRVMKTKQIISNPRKHTGKGYYTKNKRSRQKHGGNDSTGSSSSTTSERKRKKRKRRR